jgi:hypothetical protein
MSEELSVRIGPGHNEPERLVIVGPPHNGVVHIKEWDASNWAAPARERDVPVTDMYTTFKTAADHRSALSVELYQIKLWLDGIQS